MSANTDKKSNFIKAVPWKAGVLFICLISMTILSFSSQPAAMARKKDKFALLPVIFGPAVPGKTGNLVFTVDSGVDREIYTMYANRTGRTRLTDNKAVDDMPAWSADGSLIAFTSDRRKAGDYEIFTMNPDGRRLRRLTSSNWDDNSPSFSPSGDRIVFASNRNGVFQIFVMNSDGSDQKPLTDDDNQSGSPEWSADGSKIVYATSRSGGIEIYTMNPDGSDKERLTSKGGPDFAPAWSPDGKQIVFTSLRDGDRRIYVMNADGSNQKRLTNFYSDWPDWSPDQVRIVFTRREGDSAVSSGDAAEPASIDAHLLFAHPNAAQVSDSNLYTTKPDGSELQPFTQSPRKKEDRANWGP